LRIEFFVQYEVDLTKQISDHALTAMEQVVGSCPGDASAQRILQVLAPPPIPLRTLQYRLKHLITRHRLLSFTTGTNTGSC